MHSANTVVLSHHQFITLDMNLAEYTYSKVGSGIGAEPVLEAGFTSLNARAADLMIVFSNIAIALTMSSRSHAYCFASYHVLKL